MKSSGSSRSITQQRITTRKTIAIWHEFAFEYLKGNQPLIAAGRDLWKELFYFIGRGKEEGPYARFFRQTQEIQNKDIICFDLQGLSGHPKLKDVLVPALLDMIANNILGIWRSGSPKVCLCGRGLGRPQGRKQCGSLYGRAFAHDS